jgi:hypothetical protein
MPVSTPPYYAVPLCAGITMTMGGIAIDAHARSGGRGVAGVRGPGGHVVHVTLEDAWVSQDGGTFLRNVWPMYVHELSGFGADFYGLPPRSLGPSG